MIGGHVATIRRLYGARTVVRLIVWGFLHPLATPVQRDWAVRRILADARRR